MPKQLENSSFEHCVNFNSGCKYMARYGFKTKQATHCIFCRETGMVRLIGRKCQYIGCYNVPNYGFEGKIGTKCLSHADEGMIRIIAKRCDESDCENTASTDCKLAVTKYCADHWKQNAKKFIYPCDFGNCRNIAEYIYKRKDRYCYIHKKNSSKKIHGYKEPKKKPDSVLSLPEICDYDNSCIITGNLPQIHNYEDSCQLLESMISPDFGQLL